MLTSEALACSGGAMSDSEPACRDIKGISWWRRLEKNIPSLALGSASDPPSALPDVLAWSGWEAAAVPSELPSSTCISPPGKRLLINCITLLGICLSDSGLFCIPPAERMLMLTLRAFTGSCCLMLGVGNDPARNNNGVFNFRKQLKINLEKKN